MRKIIETDTLKKVLFSLVVALLGGVFVHGMYTGFFGDEAILREICLKALHKSNIFWHTTFLIWAAFWVGWVTKEYWVSREQDKDKE